VSLNSTQKTSIAIGDIHGCLEQLVSLLQFEEIIDSSHNWTAGNSNLIFLGDYMDRGADGIGVLDLIMHLETKAKEADGKVIALLGNHDVIMLEAYYFGDKVVETLLPYGQNLTFKQMWLENAGGQLSDFERLEPKHVQWLVQRPVMHQIGETLLLHADSQFYLEYGNRIDEINKSIRVILEQPMIESIDRLEERFARRKEFIFDTHAARDFAQFFGVKQIVHGHTTIFNLTQVAPNEVTEPFVYADGICVNLDHALCYGGKGFVFRF
jgi:hypothetical protein